MKLKVTLRDLFWLLFVLVVAIGRADDGDRPRIRVGDSFADSIAQLRKLKVEVDERGFAFAKTDEDIGYRTCVLDKERALAVMFYSKSTGRITAISAVLFPAQRHSRINEIWTQAKSFSLGVNGGYSIEFLPTGPRQDDR